MKVLIENFIEKIEACDSQKALDAVDLIIEKLETDDDLVVEIIDPTIITNLHTLIIENLDANPRAMKLNRRFPTRRTRAIMFARAMRNGIVRTID